MSLCVELQKVVVPGDAILIFEAGNEKLRYVEGSVTVITSHGVTGTSLIEAGKRLAKESLNNLA